MKYITTLYRKQYSFFFKYIQMLHSEFTENLCLLMKVHQLVDLDLAE